MGYGSASSLAITSKNNRILISLNVALALHMALAVYDHGNAAYLNHRTLRVCLFKNVLPIRMYELIQQILKVTNTHHHPSIVIDCIEI